MEMLSLLSFSSTGWGTQLAAGASLTIRLALTTLPVGLLFGLFLALLTESGYRPAARAAVFVATVFRALPELLTLFIIYFGGQIVVQAVIDTLLPGRTMQIDGFAAGLVALALVFGAFASEIFVAGLRAVPKGQTEAAASLGFGSVATFLLVIAPQLWRFALPGLGNLWFMLLKDTALVSAVSLSELMRQTNLAVATTKQPLFFYAITCGIYLVMSLLSGRFLALLERWANRGYGVARR